MSTTARTLLVLRHSKSAYPEGTADFDRPLAAAGVRDAVTLGGWLRDQGLLPDLVVCSTAARTRQTWDLVSDQLAWADEDATCVRYDPRLYDAAPADLIGVVQETPPEAAHPGPGGPQPGRGGTGAALTGETGLQLPHLGAGRHRAAPGLGPGRARLRLAGRLLDAQGRFSVPPG